MNTKPTDAELEQQTGEPHIDSYPLWSGLPPPPADTDALVNKLRRRTYHLGMATYNVNSADLHQAADTIERLTRERDEAVARERERIAKLVKEQTGITLETLEYLASPIRTTKATN